MSEELKQAARASGDASLTMAHLSEKMRVPLNEIEELYTGEVNRLAAEAPIQQFVSTLAIARTLRILRESRIRSARS